jgi:hypothetical protein
MVGTGTGNQQPANRYQPTMSEELFIKIYGKSASKRAMRLAMEDFDLFLTVTSLGRQLHERNVRISKAAKRKLAKA